MSKILKDKPDFSLVLGGPLFQLFRRTHLSGDDLEWVWRRVLLVGLVAWLPLLVLSFIEGHALGGGIKIPFLYDIEAHVRFLVALPILVAAELIVHSRIRPVARRFLERGIIVDEDIPRFHQIHESAVRLRNSWVAEVIILILVYPVGFWVWRNQIATGVPSWYAMHDGTQWHLTLTGYWQALVSIPIFQFILVRWYFRFCIWFVFLWRVSKLNLRLIATHPDRAGGLGFLGTSSYAFAPILFAQGALLSALIATRVLHDGYSLVSFKMEAIGLVVFFMFFIVSPLLVFTSHLARAKRQALRDYGGLGSRYVREFQAKWIDGGVSRDEELLGSGDIQSLADLGNSFTVITETRLVPFGMKDLIRLAAATAVPLVPLGLLVLPLEELVQKLIGILI